jgi:threonine dehydrogenase-like Zn-dependent dehydrogenase
MKAFVMKEIGAVGMIEKPVPSPGPNDAIVKTTAALICTSDSHTVAGGIGQRTDLTLGHEGVGVVSEVGGEVEVFRPRGLLRVLESKRVDPTHMTTHTFPFDEMERAFEVADRKLEDVVKALIRF